MMLPMSVSVLSRPPCQAYIQHFGSSRTVCTAYELKTGRSILPSSLTYYMMGRCLMQMRRRHLQH